MKLRVLGFSMLLAGLVTSSGWAQVTNLTGGGSINFSALTSTNAVSVQIGDKLFSNFGFQYVDTDGNMGDDLASSALVLSALSNGVGFGVTIQLPLVATGTTIKDITLQFSATVLGPQKISDVHLDFTGSASGNGIAEVDESVFTNNFGAGQIANLSVAKTASGFTPFSGEDSTVFSNAQTEIWIQKDILVSGNPDAIPDGNSPSDFASITIIDQTFSQTVPEPSTIMLSLMGLSGLFFVRRRK